MRHLCILKSYVITALEITFEHELHVNDFFLASAHRCMVLVDITIVLIICARLMFRIFWETLFLTEKLSHTL